MAELTIGHSIQSKSIDGVKPVDMIVSYENYFKSLDELNERMELVLSSMESFSNVDTDMLLYLQDPTDFRKAVLSSRKISVEDINKEARINWDKLKEARVKHREDYTKHAELIRQGIDRTYEHLDMLKQRSLNIKHKPYKNIIQLKNAKRLNINGQVEAKVTAPLAVQVQNLVTFYNKVFFQFIDNINRILNTLKFNEQFTLNTKIDFSKFYPGVWMKNMTPIKRDSRFRTSAKIYRSSPMQGNKTIFAGGPGDTDTEDIQDWDFIVNTIRAFSVKFLVIPNLTPIEENTFELDVDDNTAIAQRLKQLEDCLNHLDDLRDYTTKLDPLINRMTQQTDRLRNQAGNVRNIHRIGKGPNARDDEIADGMPSISKIVMSLSHVQNSVYRLITDFNNIYAGLLRTVGALVYICEQELKAYEKPYDNPPRDTTTQSNQG